MKKKKFILFPLLALVLSSCLFDTDDDGLTNWLSDQGMPSSYKVQTVTVNDLTPVSAEVFRDSFPKSAWVYGLIGAANGMSYDASLDFGLDSAFLDTLNDADSAVSYLHLRLYDSYYGANYLSSNFFPIKEDLTFNVSWVVSEKITREEVENLSKVANDSTWAKELLSWKPKSSADTTISISINRTTKNGSITAMDSLLTFDMPKALVDEVRKNRGNRRLQLRVSASSATHIYRFYGAGHVKYYPQLFFVAKGKKDHAKAFSPQRAATVYVNHEDCSDCLILHGDATYDSMLVEFPSKPIMKALSDFYGDEFPNTFGDSNDVRQAVVMAEVTFFRDDSKGKNEHGFPIMVLASSYVDSADTSVLYSEAYKLNRKLIDASGHPNMVFHEGDSLTLQVTAGMRDFINRASDGRTFKMQMRLGRSVVLDKDSTYSNHLYTKTDTVELSNGEKVEMVSGDTLRVYMGTWNYERDFASYDFTSIKNKPARLKLWLASKRGEE